MPSRVPSAQTRLKGLSPHFYFPTLDVAATMIAKTGNTSVKTFLAAAELVSRTQSDPSQRIAHFPDSLADGLSIHGTDSVIHSFRVAELPPKASVRLVVLRNPHRRFMSMFANKIVDQQDPWIVLEYGHLPWNLHPLDTLDSARAKVIEMLNWLDDGHLLEDPHWRPQTVFLATGDPYNVVVDTTDLHHIPAILGQLDPALAWLGEIEMPVRNTSDDISQRLLYTRRAADLVETMYHSDFDWRKVHDLDDADRWDVADEEGPGAEDSWMRAQTRMAVRRLDNRSRHFTSVISQMESSRSWRVTRPLRRATEVIRRITPGS